MEKFPNNNEQLDSGAEKAEVPQETLEEFGEKATETAEATAAGLNNGDLPPTTQRGEREVSLGPDTQSVGDIVEAAETSEDEETEKKKRWTKETVLRCISSETLTIRKDEVISKEAFVRRGVEEVYKGLTWLQDAIESDSETRDRDFASDILGDSKKPMLYSALVALGAYEDPKQREAMDGEDIMNPILKYAAEEASRIQRECHMGMASAGATKRIRSEALSERNVDAILVGIEKLGDNIEEALSECYENQENKPSRKVKESVSKFAERFSLPVRPEPKDLPEFGTPEQ